jgi:hypothetical protein
MYPQFTYLKEVFCDGSIVYYSEEREYRPGATTTVTRWGDGHRETFKVASGYIAAKIAFFIASGNEHKILDRH